MLFPDLSSRDFKKVVDRYTEKYGLVIGALVESFLKNKEFDAGNIPQEKVIQVIEELATDEELAFFLDIAVFEVSALVIAATPFLIGGIAVVVVVEEVQKTISQKRRLKYEDTLPKKKQRFANIQRPGFGSSAEQNTEFRQRTSAFKRPGFGEDVIPSTYKDEPNQFAQFAKTAAEKAFSFTGSEVQIERKHIKQINLKTIQSKPASEFINKWTNACLIYVWKTRHEWTPKWIDAGPVGISLKLRFISAKKTRMDTPIGKVPANFQEDRATVVLLERDEGLVQAVTFFNMCAKHFNNALRQKYYNFLNEVHDSIVGAVEEIKLSRGSTHSFEKSDEGTRTFRVDAGPIEQTVFLRGDTRTFRVDAGPTTPTTILNDIPQGNSTSATSSGVAPDPQTTNYQNPLFIAGLTLPILIGTTLYFNKYA